MDADKKLQIKLQIKQRYKAIFPYLTEKGKRIWAASEAMSVGHGGNEIVSEVTNISRMTINHGKEDILKGYAEGKEKIRESGGGRKKLVQHQPKLLEALNTLIDPCTRGDPESPLRWTCKSARNLASALKSKGYDVSYMTVCTLLQDLDYSLQSNRKREEGNQNPDRDAQFHHINNMVKKFQKAKQPVISVDAKKKENIGNFANRGQEWEKKGKPRSVNTYDFPDEENGKASLYGIFDIVLNKGWMNVGISKDTAEFAVESIRRWWKGMGIQQYPDAQKLLVTADGGGSNGYRVRLWKVEIQRLANEIGLEIQVCHFPPGTSKWNKIEHRMFSFVSKNWRGRPLDSIATIVSCISNTTTQKGLKIKTSVDGNIYQSGIKVKKEEMNILNIKLDKFHGEWNYKIIPQL